MVVKQDQSEIMQTVRSMRNNILLASLFILLFLVWMVQRQARTLAQPIEQLIDASETGEITSLHSGPITEINQLTITLQQMLLALQANQDSLDKKVRQRTLQLKQQSGEMESILTSIQEGLLVINKSCLVIRANQKIATLLGFEHLNQLDGISVNTLFVDANLENADLFSAITEEHALSTERKMRSINGEEIPVQISVALLESIDGELHTDGAVLIAHDLRERIQAEKERTEQANQLSYQEGLAEMSTNVLHNIGNAVAGLNGRAEIINSTLEPLQQIQQQLEHANKIDDLPRLQQGLKQLSTILEQLQDTETTSPSILLTLTADGTVRFQLVITDNGVGISHEQQKRIFQRNVTTKARGTGIGLHSVSTFIHSLRGTISVHSGGPGQGASFTILLPRDGSKTAD